eukprot:scaffold54325_cov43-Cyclotella_meneghiniana.AAC.1
MQLGDKELLSIFCCFPSPSPSVLFASSPVSRYQQGNTATPTFHSIQSAESYSGHPSHNGTTEKHKGKRERPSLLAEASRANTLMSFTQMLQHIEELLGHNGTDSGQIQKAVKVFTSKKDSAVDLAPLSLATILLVGKSIA